MNVDEKNVVFSFSCSIEVCHCNHCRYFKESMIQAIKNPCLTIMFYICSINASGEIIIIIVFMFNV